MALETVLQEMGLSEGDARFLSSHHGFHHKQKSGEELEALFNKIASSYGITTGSVIEAVLKFPPFAGYDHARVVEQATAVYQNKDKVIEAVLKHPQFAGLDHARVVRQKCRLGRIIDMERQEILERLLQRPVLAGYSAKRYIAALDVGRTLVEEGFTPGSHMLTIFFTYVAKSPYVPNTERKRISQIQGPHEDPPLLTCMRRTLASGN